MKIKYKIMIIVILPDLCSFKRERGHRKSSAMARQKTELGWFN